MAFSLQLVKFDYFSRHGTFDAEDVAAYLQKGDHRKEKWWQAVETASARDAWKHISEIHAVIAELELRMTECLDWNKLQRVAEKLPKANVLSKDRAFLREGDLKKFCQSGKIKNYRFYLFSDQLIYAHHTFSGEWKVHNQLSLTALRIEDCKKQPCNFRINHPTKSFMVSANSAENKKSWMRAILKAKSGADRRSQEKRRMSSVKISAPAPVQTSKKSGRSVHTGGSPPHHQRSPSHPLNNIPAAKFTLTRIRDENCKAYVQAKSPVLTVIKQERLSQSNQVEELFRSSASDMAELKKRFYAAVEISATVLDDTTDMYSDEQKLQLYGLFKQAKAGDAPQHFEISSHVESNDVAVSKWEAWAKNRGLGKAQAMINFVNLLGSIAPTEELSCKQVDVTQQSS